MKADTNTYCENINNYYIQEIRSRKAKLNYFEKWDKGTAEQKEKLLKEIHEYREKLDL